jgi:hypothetical protein
MRYKIWRSNKDKELHLLCREGSEAFEALPAAIRGLGPWTGSKEGDVDRLRLPYRLMLAEQGFVVIPRVEAPTGERQRSCCPPPGKHRLP